MLHRIFAHLFADQNFRQAGGDRYVWLVADPLDDLALRQDDLVEDDQTEAEAQRDWLEFERDMVGWEELVGASRGDVATWLLREGLAPGQPFLVWLRPHYSVDYYGEHDLDIEAEVVLVDPWSDERAAEAWEEWIEAGYDFEKEVDDNLALFEIVDPYGGPSCD